MSMHLVGPALNTNGNTKKKRSNAELKAQANHNAWLRKQGIHPDQLAAKAKPKSRTLKLDLVQDRDSAPCSNGFAPGGAKKSVFDSEWQKTYEDDPEMAERETIALAKAQALKSRLSPIYNKGPVQLVTAGLSPKDFGKRRP